VGELVILLLLLMAGLSRPSTTRSVQRTEQGSARYANLNELLRAGVYTETPAPGQLLLAAGEQILSPVELAARDDQPLVTWAVYEGDRHLLTLAPTRSGKGVSVVIPNLLHYAGSILVTDPKGENCVRTWRRRLAMGQTIHVLDPFGITGAPQSRFNPLAIITGPDDPMASIKARAIADALILPSGGDSHWTDGAKAILTAFVLHVATSALEAGRRNLGRVRELLTTEFPETLVEMRHSSLPQLRSLGGQIASIQDRELASILSTVNVQTNLLDEPVMLNTMAESDFSFADLKAPGGCTVYLVLPVNQLVTFNRWLRLMVQIALQEFVDAPGIPSPRTVFLLDEFANLGRLSSIEQAVTLQAGYGLSVWMIVQDLPQLMREYREGWQSLVANAGVIQAFGTRDLQTAEYLSRLLGQTTVEIPSAATIEARVKRGGNIVTSGDQLIGRPLQRPEEIMDAPPEQSLMFVKGVPPFYCARIYYYRRPEFRRRVDDWEPGVKLPPDPQPLYDPDPLAELNLSALKAEDFNHWPDAGETPPKKPKRRKFWRLW